MDVVSEAIRNLLNERLELLENYLDADVISYYGQIVDSIERQVKEVIEDLQHDKNKHSTCYIILTTYGGSINPVNRMVNILRHFYKEVNFIVPDYAYSAGTIFCMSGDNILMNYFSTLGPVDPQITTVNGKVISALEYLDIINELLVKEQNNTISQVELNILKNFDLAELRIYEQAKELAVVLITEWLEKYNLIESKNDAAKIANILSDNKKWKVHNRIIDIYKLRDIGLKIIDYEENLELKNKIDFYYNAYIDCVKKFSQNIFIHTRRSFKNES